MKRIRISIVLFFLFTQVLTLPAAQTPVDVADSLLNVYEKSSKKEKVQVARQIILLNAGDDNLIHLNQTIDNNMPNDSLDFLVWLAAERFYYNKSYFKESLGYIDKSLPLAARNNPEYYATLLCDRGYCLFKTSRNTEAAKAEMEAEQFSRQHRLMMPLARACNYLAIIDLSLGYIDEAKHFVGKAIETDQLTGSDQNTHNYLGIACEVYSVAKEPDKAIDYGRRAVEAARAIGYDAGVVNHLSQLSYAYNRKGDLQQALALSQEAVRTVEGMKVVDRNLLAISLEYVAFNLLDMKRNSEAVPVLRRAIALQEELGNTRSSCYDHRSLAEALEPDNPREALAAMRRYSTMMDSLHYADMHEALSKANATMHNDELQEANEQSDRQKRLILFASLAGLLLLLAVIVVLSYLNRMKTRTQRAVRQLQRARESFFTNVTHELRTPLTIILGTTQQLQQSSEGERIKEPLAAIERNGRSLLTLVNQLLDISKVSLSGVSLSWLDGDVAMFVSQIVDQYRPMANMKGINLQYHSPKTSVRTFFVPDYMQKMVGNLLSNALKFSPDDDVVTVSLSASIDTVSVSIADHGEGILPEDLDHVFEPFYQGANNTHGGTGVGLALVNQLAKALEGRVEVHSRPGQETVFTVSLPLKTKMLEGEHEMSAEGLSWEIVTYPEMVADVVTRSEKDPEDDFDDDGRTRILVVEDNADMATYIGKILNSQYAVFYAADGAEGFCKAEQIIPDLIVTDVMMPDIDGLELCRRIRQSELTNHIPVIIVTARVEDRDRLQGIEAGADAYLYKPFMAEELLLRITKLLESRRTLQRKFAALNPHPSSTYAERFLRKLDDIILLLMPKQRVDAATVAKEMGMSRQQLGRKLRAVADTTPSDYILNLRLQEVCHLLQEQPQLTLLDISLRCGFADNAHLTHVFQRRFGITPSQYKLKVKSE